MTYLTLRQLTGKTSAGDILNVEPGTCVKLPDDIANKLLSEGKVRPVQDIITEAYQHHMTFLSALPFVDVQGLDPSLHQRIQEAITRMDTAAEAEDLGAFMANSERVESLYLHAVALCCPNAAPVKIYSDVLGCHLWIVPTLRDMALLQADGVKDPVYTYDEVNRLKGTPPELLKTVNESKTVMPGNTVKAVTRHSDQEPVKPYNPSRREAKANG
jgi:hypothetical protein